MKIIRLGITPGDDRYERTCKHCETTIEFKKSEGSITYGQCGGDYITIICPICKSPISVNLRKN